MTTVSLHSGFGSWCDRLTDKVAVVYCDADERRATLTYGSVDYISTEIAHKLHSHGCLNCVVTCLCKPSEYVPPLMIGILRAKCAFMFLDIEDSKSTSAGPLSAYITNFLAADQKLFEDALDASPWKVLDSLWGNIFVLAKYVGPKDITVPVNSATSMGIAYVMKTSGTTGPPKVVRVPHECILPNINYLRELLGVSPDDMILQAAPLSFDPCIVEIFLALSSGATLFMTSDTVKMIPRLVSVLIVTNAVSIVQVTPSFFLRLGKRLVQSTLLVRNSCLRALIFGGESCPTAQLLHKWREKGNKTKFYNIYGITEVSCWATCSQIDVDSGSSEPVALGDPLEGTVLEVRNENGDAINEGLGSLFIGGTQRRCLIGPETLEDLSTCHMRDTGDIVCRSADNKLIYVGRRDRMFKYSGKKINPLCLEEMLKSKLMLEDCHCHYVSKRKQLMVFVMLSEEKDREKMIKSVDDILKQECHCPYRVFPVSAFPMSRHGSTFIQLILVSAQPTTIAWSNVCTCPAAVGKVNYRALMKLAEKMEGGSRRTTTAVDPKALLKKLWNEMTGRRTDDEVNPESNFILNGGNSINAVNIAQEVELAAGYSLPLLLETILNETFSSVVAYMETTCHSDGPRLRWNNPRKRKQEAAFQEHCNRVVRISPCFYCVSRFDRWVQCACGETCHSGTRKEKSNAVREEMSINWKYDLLKCVDASPLLVHYERGDQVVFIGSHYGKFSAVGFTGVSFWDAYLPDRIESSACISVSGRYVAVGCYDHHVYCLRSDCGALLWSCQTGAEVKSSVTLNKINNALLCGSHDRHIYCINFETGCLKWRKQISEGSVFASPSVSYEPYCIYGSTLDGCIASLCPDTGNILWSYTLSRPIFSSPLIVSSGVCVCCVGGTVNLLDHKSGHLLWTTKVGGPIFSSPVLHSEQMPFIIFGCHDKHLYVIKESDGSVVHSVSLESPIYSTAFCVGKAGEGGALVTASTEGTLHVVDCNHGTKLASYRLPGDVFSSPIVYKDDIIVGCRDNCVYSIKFR